ncbi:MAG: PLP-dependent aspartate aminotransferase family protein [Vampirovibrionales bacterium]|nr:PLP-dependent aspartate aminotransferase family protein [Vampirovibrionales bacterium]
MADTNGYTGFNTRAVHVGQAACPVTGSVIPPLYQTSTFVQTSLNKDNKDENPYFYSRFSNPTIDALEAVLADLEKGEQALFFASGMGALTTMFMALLRPGDHIIGEANLYGGTDVLMRKILAPMDIALSFVDCTDLAALKAAIQPNTKLVHIESPTNPMLKILDLKAIASVCQAAGVLLSVDNTFCSPYLQTPLCHGADIVMHSTTKSIGGHSDVVGGCLVYNQRPYAESTLHDKLKFYQVGLGATADPFAAWLTLRGIKTLGVRTEASCKTAQQLAEWLQQQDAIEWVSYPGLASHSQKALAMQQMKAFGSMIVLKPKGGPAMAEKLLQSTSLFRLAVSLGGIESLACIPARQTHAGMSAEDKAAIGLTDDVIRLSVGLEAFEDLQADLAQALQKIQPVNA